MENKLIFSCAFVVIAVVSSCSNGENFVDKYRKDELCVMTVPPKLSRLTWLIGEWEYNFEGGRTIESWSNYFDNKMLGYSYTLMGNDTVSFESILIEEVYPDLFYIPTVREQNNAQPIKFKLSELKQDYVLFENPKHDFPQKISYQKLATDSLVAEISGLMEGDSSELSEIKFPMRRIK